MALGLIYSWSSNAQVIEDFESWKNDTVSGVVLTKPVAWTGSDSFVVGVGKLLNPNGTYQAQTFQENPGFAGMGALQVTSKAQDAILAVGMPAKDYPSIATNSQIAVDALNNTYLQSGGTAITFDPVTTSMYIKNNTVGGDTTFVLAEVIDNSNNYDSVIAVADTILTSNIANYTQIILPFDYVQTTLSGKIIRYTISSGNPLALLDSTNTFSVHDGTEITVDDISIEATASGLKQLINAERILSVYPTTTSDVLHVDLLKERQDVSVEIYTLSGQLVSANTLKDKKNKIFINNLSSGSYVYVVKFKGLIYQTGKFIH